MTTSIESQVSALEEIIASRRSIRLFDSTPVPAEIIEHSLDLALLAPNSSNLQPWEFYWVKTPALKTELVINCMSQAAAATAQELIVCVARTNTWRQGRENMLKQLAFHDSQGTRIPKAASHYYQTLVPLMYSQGIFGIKGYAKKVYSFFKGLKSPTPRGPSTLHEMQVWAIKSTALACENFMLSIRAHGFDTCPMEGFDEKRVHSLLKLPRDSVIAMVIGVGKRGPNGVTLPRIRGDRGDYIKKV